MESPRRLREEQTTRGMQEREMEPEKKKAFQELLKKELDQGIVTRIRYEEVGYISPVFIVPKPPKTDENGRLIKKWRKVVDCRRVNAEQVNIHFRMEGPETVQQLASENDWATSIDLKSAFNHLRVSERMRPFLAFCYDRECYAYRAMPFGSKHSPRLFTEALGYGMRFIRQNWQVRVICYMDDILLLHQDKEYLERSTLQIAVYLRYLGWTPSIDKCEFTPKHVIRFLGWSWSFITRTIEMTEEMQGAVQRMISETMRIAQRGGSMKCKRLGTVIGTLNFLRAQFPRASLYLRTMHSALTTGVNAAGWLGSFTVPRTILSELQFWLRNVSRNEPYCFVVRQSQATLTTDAAEPGWVADLRIGPQLFETSGFFSTQDSLPSSNQRETAAVLRSLLDFKSTLSQAGIRAMTVRSDNSATVCNLQRQGAGIALLHMTREIFKILQRLDIRINVAHIPGKDNGHADALSRMEVTGDYELKLEWFQRGIGALGEAATLDLFAHNRNNKLPRFVAMPGPLAEGAVAMDAFDYNWTSERLYIFPPVQLILRILRRLQEEKVRAIVVVPKWPSRPWWPLFREMALKTVELGEAEEVLKPGLAMTGSHITLRLPPGMFLMSVVDPK